MQPIFWAALFFSWDGEKQMEETTPAEYVDFFTSSGTIRLMYELSLGDLLIGTLLSLVLLFLIIKAVFRALWG